MVCSLPNLFQDIQDTMRSARTLVQHSSPTTAHTPSWEASSTSKEVLFWTTTCPVSLISQVVLLLAALCSSFASLWAKAYRILPTPQSCFKAHGQLCLEGKVKGQNVPCVMQRQSRRKGSSYQNSKSLSSCRVEVSSPWYTNPIPMFGSQSVFVQLPQWIVK